jgi:Uncharacterized low-complexity protein
MSSKTSLKPIAVALGATFAVSLAASPIVNAAENPFQLHELAGGYMVADHDKESEGKCGEGKCGENKEVKKEAEGKCGEGKCGENKEMKKEAEGKCGEGKCGEKK